jgi:sortase A
MRKTMLSLCLLGSVLMLGNTGWIHAKALVAQLLIAQAWKNTRSTHESSRPWPWADFWPVARMTVSNGRREIFVLNTASGEALAFGPGQVVFDAMAGEDGSMTIAGHRDTHFRFLGGLGKGDRVAIEGIDGITRVYDFVDREVVDSRGTQLHPGVSNTLELVTCYPSESVVPGGPLRLIVRLVESASKETSTLSAS